MDTNPEQATRAEIETAVVAWRATREQRLAKEKEAAKIKDREQELRLWLVEAMSSQKYEGVVINDRITTVAVKEVYIVEDQQALADYILETRELDLLQFRLSTSAVALRAEAGVTVPGTGTMRQFDLSDRKVK